MDTPSIDISKFEARDAARLAVQSAVAAAAMFLAMKALDWPERFVGVLSAVLVVQPSVGNTLTAAIDRVVGTLIGTAIGLACMFALPYGYGTAVALFVSMLATNAVAGIRPDWRYGVVAAVALSLGSEQDVWVTAKERALAITLGAVLGAVTSGVVWPDRAERRARRHLGRALAAVAQRLEQAVEAANSETDAEADEAVRTFHTNLESARSAADGVRLTDDGDLVTQIRVVDRLYNSVLMLNRVAEETDGIGAHAGDDFVERLDSIRECACAILEHLADGELDQSERLGQLREQLDGAREAIGTESGGDEGVTHSHAMVFALDEIEDGLAAVVDAFGPE